MLLFISFFYSIWFSLFSFPLRLFSLSCSEAMSSFLTCPPLSHYLPVTLSCVMSWFASVYIKVPYTCWRVWIGNSSITCMCLMPSSRAHSWCYVTVLVWISWCYEMKKVSSALLQGFIPWRTHFVPLCLLWISWFSLTYLANSSLQ